MINIKKALKNNRVLKSLTGLSIKNEPSSANSDETVEYEEIYEPDPYLNDIINTEPEISYPNPYSNYEPNVQTDGVSHTYEANY